MNLLVPLPVAVPLVVAALLAALQTRLPRRLRDAIAIVTAAAVTVVCGLLLHAVARAADRLLVRRLAAAR